MNAQARSLIARDWLGSAVMLSFTLIAIQRWDSTGAVFFLLIAADNLIKSFFFYIRSNATIKSQPLQSFTAYVSASLPLFYLPVADDVTSTLATSAQLLMIFGFLLVALATIDLGTNLGISPARRSQVAQSGTYKLARHPMYLGHILAEFSLVLANPLNAVLFCLSISLYALRMKWENAILRKN